MPDLSVTEPRRPESGPLVHARSVGARTARVTVAGELDISTVAALDDALRQAEANADLVVLDLGRLEFLDSSAAHVLMAANRRIRDAGGRLIVMRGSAEVEWFLALVGLDRPLAIGGLSPEASLGRSWEVGAR